MAKKTARTGYRPVARQDAARRFSKGAFSALVLVLAAPPARRTCADRVERYAEQAG